MSVALTLDQVRARTKTVTRRHKDSWKTLKPGDRITLIEKGMGLAKGEKQQAVVDVEILDVRIEPLHLLCDDEYGWAEVAAEGFPDMPPADFAAWWLESHGVPEFRDESEFMAYEVVRIEWRYL
jgi:hypothetical protein